VFIFPQKKKFNNFLFESQINFNNFNILFFILNVTEDNSGNKFWLSLLWAGAGIYAMLCLYTHATPRIFDFFEKQKLNKMLDIIRSSTYGNDQVMESYLRDHVQVHIQTRELSTFAAYYPGTHITFWQKSFARNFGQSMLERISVLRDTAINRAQLSNVVDHYLEAYALNHPEVRRYADFAVMKVQSTRYRNFWVGEERLMALNNHAINQSKRIFNLLQTD
jgi:hypothetical protein